MHYAGVTAMLISDEYRTLNAKQHERNDGYGVNGHRHLQTVLKLIEKHAAASVLDYGCGRAALAKHAKRVSPVPFRCYDPAVPEYAQLPEPADLVVCTDVLEHVEPLYLVEVLMHIAGLATKAVFFEIACRPAKRVLDDGRNAHILLRDGDFWLDTVRSHFDVSEYMARPGHSVVLVGQPGGTLWT